VTLYSHLKFDEAEHRYYLDTTPVPSVTTVLQATGLINYDFLAPALREKYLARGQAVHLATCHNDEGDLVEDTVSDEIRGYLEAWRTFRRDYNFVPHLVEQRVCNSQYGFAGTLDRTGRIRGGAEFIIDIKTGAAPAATRCQLAAYASCLPHPRTRLRRCAELHADGSYRVIPYQTSDYQRDLNEFLAALETYRAREEK
jgi:hypothetical protein